METQANVTALIETLLQESFSQACHFSQMTLEKVGKEIEQVQELLDQPSAPPEWASQKPSYDRVVLLYCQILMEFEQQRQPLPEAPLASLLSVPAPEPLLEETLPPNPEPAPQSQAIELMDLDQPLTGLAEASPAPTVATPAQPEAADLSSCLSSPVAREHLELAHYFEGIKDAGNFPFASHHINRLTDQSLCFCLEAECGDKLTARLSELWPHREEVVRALLDPSARKFDLHPALKAELDRLAASHGQWLMDGRFPYAAALTSLRYFVATPGPERHQTSLLDYGLFLLLFGRDRPLDGVALQNHLGAKGLDEERTVEVAFRLSRLFKLRTKVISPTSRLSEERRLLLQEDVHELVTMLARLTFPAGEKAKQVA